MQYFCVKIHQFLTTDQQSSILVWQNVGLVRSVHHSWLSDNYSCYMCCVRLRSICLHYSILCSVFFQLHFVDISRGCNINIYD